MNRAIAALGPEHAVATRRVGFAWCLLPLAVQAKDCIVDCDAKRSDRASHRRPGTRVVPLNDLQGLPGWTSQNRLFVDIVEGSTMRALICERLPHVCLTQPSCRIHKSAETSVPADPLGRRVGWF